MIDKVWSHEKQRYMTEEERQDFADRVEALRSNSDTLPRDNSASSSLKFDANIYQLRSRHRTVRSMLEKEIELEAEIQEAQQDIVSWTAQLDELRSRRIQAEQDLTKFLMALS